MGDGWQLRPIWLMSRRCHVVNAMDFQTSDQSSTVTGSYIIHWWHQSMWLQWSRKRPSLHASWFNLSKRNTPHNVEKQLFQMEPTWQPTYTTYFSSFLLLLLCFFDFLWCFLCFFDFAAGSDWLDVRRECLCRECFLSSPADSLWGTCSTSPAISLSS